MRRGRRFAVAAIATVCGLGWCIAAGGCNTIKGVGTDIYSAANSVQEQMFY